MPENSNTPGSAGRIDLLAQKFLDDDLTEGQAEELLTIMTEHPDAGPMMLDQLMVHELLRQASRAEQVLPHRLEREIPRHGSRWAVWLAGSAAVLAMAALILTLVRAPQVVEVAGPRQVPAKPEPTTRAVAVLGDSFNATWAVESGSPTVGSPLDPGVIELRSGLARIDFFNGARVVLKGPAVFELVSMDRAICRSGSLAAEVPPQARGFVIATPDGEVRDLGTAFGLEVGSEGAAVHVLDGEVEIDDNGPVQFHAGEGVRLVNGRATERFQAKPGAFMLSADTSMARSGGLARRVRTWTTAANGWNADPHLLARFDFENSGVPAFRLRNTAARGMVADGTIINCPVIDGRWPGKGALQFRSLSDRVRLEVPGEFHSLSYTAWISVHSLSNRFNSLLMTEGFEYGQVHWQIVENGVLRLGYCADPSEVRRPSNYDSPPLLGPEMFGQWLHIAVVVDGTAKQVSHYLNGELVAAHQADDLVPLRIGTACIGNWAEPYGELLIRNFSGIIDEMTVHDRALGGTEVHAMFKAGCPSTLPPGK